MRAYMTKLTVALRNFARVCKNMFTRKDTKVKLNLQHSVRVQKGIGSTAVPVLTLALDGRRVIRATRRPSLPPPLGKEHRYLCTSGCFDPQSQSGRAWRRINILSLTGLRTPNRPACSHSMCRRSYPGPP